MFVNLSSSSFLRSLWALILVFKSFFLLLGDFFGKTETELFAFLLDDSSHGRRSTVKHHHFSGTSRRNFTEYLRVGENVLFIGVIALLNR